MEHNVIVINDGTLDDISRVDLESPDILLVLGLSGLLHHGLDDGVHGIVWGRQLAVLL